MHYCERCGSHLGEAYACPVCGTPHSAPPTWQVPSVGAPRTGPHPLYQSLIPPMPQPQPYEVLEPPDEEAAEADEEPPAPGRRRGATRSRSRRAARRRGGTAKLVLGVAGGLVLVGVAATVLPGELLPTGPSRVDNAQSTTSSTMAEPTATASAATAAPRASASIRKPVPHRPSHSAQPSLPAVPSGTAAHTAVPVSAPMAPSRTQNSTPPPAPTQPTPTPRPRPTQPPTCFLFWCD